MSLLDVLERLSVLNRDDGFRFTNTERLDAIASLLRGSAYSKVETNGLFHLYSSKPVKTIKEPVLIVSSHVDCQKNITKCFLSTGYSSDTILGTFDNAITNASIVYLMLYGNLPGNVLVAFTGDEEENGHGALDLARFIEKNHLDVLNIFVLDVTEEGWDTEADYTIENDFWHDDFGKKVVELAEQSECRWNFVPEDPDDIPNYVPEEVIIHVEAYDDESWDYDEEDLPCFSFCLPTKGNMHSNDGILARVNSFECYTEMLRMMLTELS